MVSPIRDAAINGMVEELLAPPPKAQFTIKKKVAICKAASLFVWLSRGGSKKAPRIHCSVGQFCFC